nr:gustatory receptor 35.1 [Papilio dardanus]
MKILKTLRFLFFFGNFLLLFRNLSFKSRGTRYLIYFFILLDITISISNSVSCLYFKLYLRLSDFLYLNVTLVNSIILIILSIYHSENLKSLLIVLNSQDDFMYKDEMYLKNLERKRKILLLVLIIYLGIKVLPSLLYSRYFAFGQDLPSILVIIFKLNVVFWDARFLYEYIFMCALLYIFSEQLECIIRSVVREKRFIHANFDNSDTSLNQLVCSQYVQKISQWSEAFSHVEEAIKLFNIIFGVQFSIMISSTIFYVTSFLYEMTDFIVHRHIGTAIAANYLTRITIYHIQIFVLSRAGQRLQNNVEHLKRRVTKIFVLSLTGTYFKTFSFNIISYYTSCRPRRRLPFGPLDVNMSLAPTFILLYTSYTILALQFNNVV